MQEESLHWGFVKQVGSERLSLTEEVVNDPMMRRRCGRQKYKGVRLCAAIHTFLML